MTKQRTLIHIVFAPALVDNDGRTLAVVQGIERAHSGVRLEWKLSEAGRPIALPQRDGWLAEAAVSGEFPRRVLPDGVAPEVAKQFRHSMDQPHVPPRGLPALSLPKHIHSPEIPHYLGWLNYWSAATAQAIGFPDPARDAALLSRARRTATGGWVVRLTETPLDLDNPLHLEALLRAYERFPEIGGRVPPR
ncbi:DUF5953 family protein [Corallococcus terminator]